MNIDKRPCVLFFMKLPEPGRVKTRLGRVIGPEQAAELYRSFVEDVTGLLGQCETPTICYYEPGSAGSSIQNWLGPRHRYLAQEGADLGERLEHAFRASFKMGFSATIVIGTDSPDLPVAYLQEAGKVLALHDSVIGPSMDGGYYLIGLRQHAFTPEIFRGITWSTSRVYDQTLAALDRQGLKPHVLPVWHDVDTHADLCALVERSINTAFTVSKTYQAILQNGWHQQRRFNRGSWS